LEGGCSLSVINQSKDVREEKCLISRVRTEKECLLSGRKQRKRGKKKQRVVNNNVKGRGETNESRGGSDKEKRK